MSHDRRESMESRRTARGVILSPAGSVLLMLLGEPSAGRQFWITPGGRIEDGEDGASALQRELLEETCRDDLTIGPAVWTRDNVYEWNDHVVHRSETYYLVETEEFGAEMAGDPESSEVRAFQRYRWWSPREMAASGEQFGPSQISALVSDLIREGPPSEPIHLGSTEPDLGR